MSINIQLVFGKYTMSLTVLEIYEQKYRLLGVCVKTFQCFWKEQENDLQRHVFASQVKYLLDTPDEKQFKSSNGTLVVSLHCTFMCFSNYSTLVQMKCCKNAGNPYALNCLSSNACASNPVWHSNYVKIFWGFQVESISIIIWQILWESYTIEPETLNWSLERTSWARYLLDICEQMYRPNLVSI